MDKKILKPLKKSDFALPARQKKKLRRAKNARKKRARPLVEEVPVEAPNVEAPVLEEEAPMVQKKERRRARQFSLKFPLKGLSVKLKKLPPLPSGRAKLPSNFDWSRLDKKPKVVEVGERLRVKLPGITKKLKKKRGTANLPINLDSSPEYVLQDPTPADTVLQSNKYHRPVRKFAAITPVSASKYFKNV